MGKTVVQPKSCGILLQYWLDSAGKERKLSCSRNRDYFRNGTSVENTKTAGRKQLNEKGNKDGTCADFFVFYRQMSPRAQRI